MHPPAVSQVVSVREEEPRYGKILLVVSNSGKPVAAALQSPPKTHISPVPAGLFCFGFFSFYQPAADLANCDLLVYSDSLNVDLKAN